MAKKQEKEKEKEKKEQNKEKEKNEKRVIKKQPKKPEHKYSLNELADLFGISVLKMRSVYKIRGLNKEEKLSYDEANKIVNNIV